MHQAIMYLILIIVCIYIAAIGSVQSQTSHPTIRCRRCERAPNTNNCTIFDLCDSRMEMCYMEEVLTEQLTIIYNGGCRARDVCMTSMGRYYVGKRDNSVVSCSKCCDQGDDCNKNLCALPGRPSLGGSFSRSCRRCEKATQKSDCQYTVPCGPQEVCYMEEVVTEQLTILYNGGCRSADICNKGSGHFVNRSPVVSCSKCCNSTDDCNNDLCFTPGPGVYLPAQPFQRLLRCRRCEQATSLDDCVSQIMCGAGEICYMEEVVTEQLTILYNAGCRAKDVCQAGRGHYVTQGNGRKRSAVSAVSCSQCCDYREDCNSRLCGIKSTLVHVSQCYGCGPGTSQPHISNPNDCVLLTPCQSNEVCYAQSIQVGGQDQYIYGCKSRSVCQVLMEKAMNETAACEQDPTQCAQQTDPCTACCGDGGCNYGQCREMLRRIYMLVQRNLWSLNTLQKMPFGSGK